ncbi:histone deacetylase complex protein [Pseudozyma hubeiensis SY62]|uniref:Histone deacetylase complex protein n=1 Tax=Pseudozyma hubeiensis (strain SY62) TaxID=1305764 RepID=R9P0G2_PSEHS|nr:histone deacetylase complex protein [Pseudozyma hubeiensis SY62]GAC94688.1 histone deacetylase complex protein [Pseudozyma hubeiensis SY62]
MVFIVKIPNRSRANTPEASNTPSNESVPPLPTMSHQAFQMDVGQAPLPAPTASAGMDVPGAASSSLLPVTSAEASTPPTQLGAELDILLAPSVLNHRYVRGVDKSLIVERPERIRAVLLGIATAIGKTTSDRPQQPPLPTHTTQHSPTKAPIQQQNVFDLSTPSQLSATTSAATAQPASANHTSATEDDDLVARLSSLTVQSQSLQVQQPAVTAQLQKFRVLHSTRSLPLDPPHPAVAFAHAHSDELVTVLESAYDQAKQKRRDARAASSMPPSAALRSSLDPADAKPERETTPTPASIASDPSLQQQAQPGPSPISPVRTSHAAYLEYLCSRAPNHPPLSHRKPTQSSPAKSIPEDSEAYTSSDGEGDDAMHLSEVPEHLPQGDLYLAGPDDHGGQDGGSGQAIRHAMGACCEAVDRVVSAAAASTGTTSSKPSVLSEIHVEDSAHSPKLSADPAPAAKRAFVLSRPPGHHCSGSTPQGFCWVNNAIVASAHAYLEHAIDRIVIFDIDLHHGNGTQNLAWRINADANKHDDQRAERISSLRAAALERARQALVAAGGSGRAHASRLAKVALTEQDEADVRRQAGPRALRLFYSSLHDIESFPCEDGDANMIKDASTCVEGAHGQWIWNGKYFFVGARMRDVKDEVRSKMVKGLKKVWRSSLGSLVT